MTNNVVTTTRTDGSPNIISANYYIVIIFVYKSEIKYSRKILVTKKCTNMIYFETKLDLLGYLIRVVCCVVFTRVLRDKVIIFVPQLQGLSTKFCVIVRLVGIRCNLSY